MKPSCLAALAAFLVLVLVAPAVYGRPPHRQKRVSDQRLGELEALLALKKLRGKLVTVPVAFGQINPNDYGRRRRSAAGSALPRHILLERLLESLPSAQDELDAYDELRELRELHELPLEGADVQNQHWTATAYERERPALEFNRPVTE